MQITTPISLAELLDKISILKIKKLNVHQLNKLTHINNELNILNKTLIKNIKKHKVKLYLDKLTKINKKLWKIEDDIRVCEKNKDFNQKFINLARSVYITNDKRAKIKLEINKKFGSKIVEIKSYKKY